YYFTKASIDYLQINDETEKYSVLNNHKNKTSDKKHDKIFKDIFTNPKEMAKFINDFTNYNVNQKELEKYNVNYITKDFKYKQADIVYKIQGKEIFYLIEHQTKVDYTMSYRMLNY